MKKLIETLLAVACFFACDSVAAEKKKLVMVAGTVSHGPMEHEFNAGCLLLKKCLDQTGLLEVVVHTNGWPKDETIFQGADAIFIYSDGGGGHPAIKPERLKLLGDLMKKGVGLGFGHYAVEVPKDKGGPEFLEWIGGYFEAYWSVNPHWVADFKEFPNHPITRGVKPFKAKDEWYYHMRFRENMQGVTPILTAVPPDSTRGKEGANDAHGGNPHVFARKGMPEHMMWTYDRPDGGRGFGFTGGHFHLNWGNEELRKLILNALLWMAKVEVPQNGVQSKIQEEELMANLDPKGGKKPQPTAAPSASGKNAKFKSGLVKSGIHEVKVDLEGAKELWLVVNDGGDEIGCDWADWIEPRLVRKDGSSIPLTELKWKSATAGHGETTVNNNVEGNPIKVKGQTFASGIGTHAVSLIQYELPEGFASFQSKIALDDGGTLQGCGSTVEFMVFTERPPATLMAANFSGGADAKPVAPQRGSGPEAAKEDLKKMTVAPGLEVTVFASEPMVRNPTDMDIDHRGRVWITEGVNYRSSIQRWGILRPEGDRIVILEDTNGDGTADSEKTFYEGKEINAALGICVLGKRIIVSRSPNVFLFTDENGDDKADGPPKVIFSGIGGVDHDHGVHAFVFGPDGKLYFNMGDASGKLKTPDGAQFIKDKAGNEINANGKPYRKGLLFRCNPDFTEVETVGWNFRNNYEVAVDSFGTLWQSDNDDDGNKSVRINYVMEFGNYGYSDELTGAGWGDAWKKANLKEKLADTEKPRFHWHLDDPGVAPTLLVTGSGSPTGLAVYEGKLLPQPFRNQMIHCEPGHNVVRAYPVKTEGAGYSAEILDLLKCSDSWFRPADVCVAPDGSVLIADWNDPGVGGHNMGDKEVATMRGRVYRVAPYGSRYTVSKQEFNTAAAAVQALQSPNHEMRYLAWTKLHELQDKAEKELSTLYKGSDERMRARALQLLARIKGKEKSYVNQAIKDQNADIRITGLRIAREQEMDLIPLLKTLVRDPSPAVRRECAIALRHHSSPQAPALWAELARQHQAGDRWYLEALGLAADKQEDAFFNAWLNAAGQNWNTPAGREIIWRSRSTKAPALLVKIIGDARTSPAEKSQYMRSLDFIKGPEKEAALLELLGAN